MTARGNLRLPPPRKTTGPLPATYKNPHERIGRAVAVTYRPDQIDTINDLAVLRGVSFAEAARRMMDAGIAAYKLQAYDRPLPSGSLTDIKV